MKAEPVNEQERQESNMNTSITVPYPLVALKSMVVFPRTRITLSMLREKSIRAVEEAMMHPRRVLITASQLDSEIEDPEPKDIYAFGTLVEITTMHRQQDGSFQVLFNGLRRVHIDEYIEQEPFMRVAVSQLVETQPQGPQADALVRHATNLFERYAQLNRRFSVEDITSIVGLKTASRLSDMLAAHLVTDPQQQQDLLETLDPLARLEKICVIMGNEIEKLREQLNQKVMPPEVVAKTRKEIDRLERSPPQAAEIPVLRSYIDWILALPWSERSEDHFDIDTTHNILEEDHYGLEGIKERIIEFLAVRQLRQLRASRSGSARSESQGQILCFIGPPGVGKTSLGRSIARALGRKFARISLGGVSDEAEIRGHRRTYVGALPGRIIQSMKTVGG